MSIGAKWINLGIFTFKDKLRYFFKGHLRYKTIISQIVPSEAQVKVFYV